MRKTIIPLAIASLLASTLVQAQSGARSDQRHDAQRVHGHSGQHFRHPGHAQPYIRPFALPRHNGHFYGHRPAPRYYGHRLAPRHYGHSGSGRHYGHRLAPRHYGHSGHRGHYGHSNYGRHFGRGSSHGLQHRSAPRQNGHAGASGRPPTGLNAGRFAGAYRR
jgi:hypothetical protein